MNVLKKLREQLEACRKRYDTVLEQVACAAPEALPDLLVSLREADLVCQKLAQLVSQLDARPFNPDSPMTTP